MGANLTISYSWWALAIVLIIGFLFASLLYYRNKKNNLSQTWTIVLFVFRFFSVSLLTFLLLNPFYQTNTKKIVKPIIIIGLDNSQSVAQSKDSVYYQKEFPVLINQLKEKLTEIYQVETYLVGEKIRYEDTLNYSDESSNYSDFFKRVKEDYRGKNIGAIIFSGDGLYNRGIDPVFAASEMGIPVYTIALGDTVLNRDARINEVQFNSIAYLGDNMPVRISIAADHFQGKPATLFVTAFGKKVFNQQFNITDDSYNKTFELFINAEISGKQRISVKLETESSENNKANNQRDIFIDILDTKKKILILANAPHPDIGTLKNSLQQSDNYLIDIDYADKFKGEMKTYDLVILHQLPSAKHLIGQAFSEIKKQNIPTLFILGKQSNLIQFNQYFKGLMIRSNNVFENAQASINPLFELYAYSQDYRLQLEELPPLLVPIGTYQLSPDANVFAFMRIRNVKTDFPLISFNTDGEYRNGLISGEGLWLWRMHDYLQNGNYEAFDYLINNTVQYLMTRKDRRFFRVISKNEYGSDENVILRAELFDQSYKPVNSQEVNLKLTNDLGEQYNHIFSPDNQWYNLNLKQLPVGIYQYSASTSLGKENYTSSGEFIINSRSLESRNLNADHGLLFRLASNHNGKMVYPTQIDQLADMLKEKNLKTKFFIEEKYIGMNDMWAIIAILLLLITVEWFLRKYFGSY